MSSLSEPTFGQSELTREAIRLYRESEQSWRAWHKRHKETGTLEEAFSTTREALKEQAQIYSDAYIGVIEAIALIRYLHNALDKKPEHVRIDDAITYLENAEGTLFGLLN